MTDNEQKTGMLTDSADIKLVLCYALSALKLPLDGDSVCTQLASDGVAHYFDIADAFVALKDGGFVVEEGGNCFVTAKGREVAAAFAKRLPVSLRDRAASSCMKLAFKRRSLADNPCEIIQTSNGCNVTMKITDGSEELMSLTLFAADAEQAKVLQKNFNSSPAEVYEAVLGLLTKTPS